jgi:flagellar hook protein FlgE
MSLSTSLSGVQAAQTDLNTIGNNIANVSTVGFKGSNAQFSDIYSNAAGGGAAPGTGVRTSNIAQVFTEGTLKATGNELDVAINGGGFFQLQTDTGNVYSRNGQFLLNSDGYLVTSDGAKVTGLTSTGLQQAIKVSMDNVAPTVTSKLTLAVNLPADDPPIDPVATPFNPADATTYSESASTSVYDSLGVQHTLTTYFTALSGSGGGSSWGTNWQVGNTDGSVVASGAGPTLTFDTSGKLLSGSGTVTTGALPDGAAGLNIALNFTGSSVSNLKFGLESVTNDGQGAGRFTGISIGSGGLVSAKYDNGQTKDIATIALASFVNPQGLIPISDNNWLASSSSGDPVIGAPATANRGSLEGSTVEGSNVDLSAQLVNLIVAQQAYQANVQGINAEQQNFQRLLQLP